MMWPVVEVGNLEGVEEREMKRNSLSIAVLILTGLTISTLSLVIRKAKAASTITATNTKIVGTGRFARQSAARPPATRSSSMPASTARLLR